MYGSRPLPDVRSLPRREEVRGSAGDSMSSTGAVDAAGTTPAPREERLRSSGTGRLGAPAAPGDGAGGLRRSICAWGGRDGGRDQHRANSYQGLPYHRVLASVNERRHGGSSVRPRPPDGGAGRAAPRVGDSVRMLRGLAVWCRGTRHVVCTVRDNAVDRGGRQVSGAWKSGDRWAVGAFDLGCAGRIIRPLFNNCWAGPASVTPS